MTPLTYELIAATKCRSLSDTKLYRCAGELTAYLGVLPHASLVAVGAPHYLAGESLVNYTRIMVDERPLLVCSISYLRENTGS